MSSAAGLSVGENISGICCNLQYFSRKDRVGESFYCTVCTVYVSTLPLKHNRSALEWVRFGLMGHLEK